MFVLKSTHEELRRRHMMNLAELEELKEMWNRLVRQINQKGGQQFLDSPQGVQFSKDEIKQLVSLCHPDKHGGSKTAEEMTRKLLAMRK